MTLCLHPTLISTSYKSHGSTGVFVCITICIEDYHTSLYSMPIAIFSAELYKSHLCQFAVDYLMLYVLYRHAILSRVLARNLLPNDA